MNTFFKTFFICAIFTFGFLAYKYFCIDSYSADLNVSKNNPVFGTHKEYKEAKPVEVVVKQTESKVQDKNTKIKKYNHKCYFFSNNGELVMVKRELAFAPSIESSIMLLLKGPMISESKKGIYSEIPSGVDLISVTRQGNDIIINLSSNFGNGGGSNSIENRIKQISRTVKIHEPSKNIFLYIDGKEVEYLGGEGVYIKQPLN